MVEARRKLGGVDGLGGWVTASVSRGFGGRRVGLIFVVRVGFVARFSLVICVVVCFLIRLVIRAVIRLVIYLFICTVIRLVI